MTQNFSNCSLDKSLEQWLSYLETIHNSEIDLGLTRIKHVGKKLNIDLGFATVITVAGTNGKGTTCAFLENALMAEGNHLSHNNPLHNITHQQSVAVYSSPHIEHFNERLRINKQDVSDELLVEAFEQIEAVREDTSLTYYEYTTLAAFLVLMKVRPDFIILEVGLGGRLDATNMIDADIAVITTIDLDHQSFLGNNREVIGYEKAGIMRPNKFAVLGDTNPTESVQTYAKEINADIKIRKKDFTIEQESEEGLWQWCYKNITLKKLTAPFIPQDNVATALMALSLLNIDLTTEKVNNIIENTKVAGRTEMFEDRCHVLLDVAHNPQAARHLAQYINEQKTLNNYQRVVAVVGVLEDKDITNILAPMTEIVEHWYLGGLPVPRSATSALIAEKLTPYTSLFNCFDNVTQAFKMANSNRDKNDLIIVFGSFYTVAEIRRLFV